MKAFLKSFLFLLCPLLVPASGYSQEHSTTPYEKRKAELIGQFLSNLGVDNATIQKALTSPNYDISPLVKQKMNAQGLSAVGMYNDLQQELEAAKSLMNDEERKEDEARTFKKLNQQQEDAAKNQYLQSDAYKLKTAIQQKYNEWAKKGEYEKSTDYQGRMTNKQSVVKDMLISIIKNYYLAGINPNTRDNFLRINSYCGNYNPDTEILELYFKDLHDILWKATIQISPDKAKYVKVDDIPTTLKDGRTVYSTQHIRVIPDECSLAFYNDNLIPTKIGIELTLKDKGQQYNEYPAVTIISSPPSSDIGKKFFTPENLQIDLTGNETITLNDVNAACNELKEKQGIQEKKAEDTKATKAALQKKFDDLVRNGNNLEQVHAQYDKIMETYKKAANVYNEEILNTLFSGETAAEKNERKYIDTKIQNLNITIKRLEGKQKDSKDDTLKKILNRLPKTR